METHLLRMLSVPLSGLSSSNGSGATSARSAHQQQQQQQQQQPQPPEPSLVVFSGGTAFNSVAGHMRQLTTRIAHVLPVSDDGGSTAEIVRVLGGPAVGDIRSRCLRLADDSDEEARAVRRLLAHRLGNDSKAAKQEWYSIVEGDDPLWEGISDAYRHIIRGFLVHFHANIMRHSTKRFDYRGGSVGNFFFAGARIFFRSLEAAIFLFSRVARIPEGSLVLPAICTEDHITLGAELADGSLIIGQHQISHPSNTGPLAAAWVWLAVRACNCWLPTARLCLLPMAPITQQEATTRLPLSQPWCAPLTPTSVSASPPKQTRHGTWTSRAMKRWPPPSTAYFTCRQRATRTSTRWHPCPTRECSPSCSARMR
jgi:hypothetical protein